MSGTSVGASGEMAGMGASSFEAKEAPLITFIVEAERYFFAVVQRCTFHPPPPGEGNRHSEFYFFAGAILVASGFAASGVAAGAAAGWSMRSTLAVSRSFAT